jgi:hypothetical protein
LLAGAAYCHVCGTPTGTTPTNYFPLPSDDLSPPPDDAPESLADELSSAHALSVPMPQDVPFPSSSSDVGPTVAMSVLAPHIPAAGSLPAAPVGIPGGLTVHKPRTKIVFPDDKPELILGRRDPHGIFVPDIDLEPYGGAQKGVSRKHARIFVEDDHVYIEDLGSSNGTYVNRQRLEARKAYRLYDKDRIWLGHMRLNFFVIRPNRAT